MQAAAAIPSELSREEFRTLYEREFAFVFHTLRRLGVGSAHLEDFTHDVFVIVFRRWGTYDASRPLRPWLFGIAYCVVADWNKKLETRKTSKDPPSEEVASTGLSPEEQAEQKQAQDWANEILDGMEMGRKTVFILHEIEGLSMPIVAETLGLPLNTAYSRLRLARRDFNQAVQQLEEGQP